MKIIIGISFLIFHSTHAGRPSVQNILNGSDSLRGEFPYMAGLRRFNQDVYCGAALVSDRHVLTAAHCAADIAPQHLSVLLGTNDLLNGGEYYDVSQKVLSDDYSVNRQGVGIAILTLSRRVTFSNNVLKIALPTSDVTDGTTATFTGYGYKVKDPENGFMSQILQKLPVNIVNQNKCADQLKQYELIQRQHLCGYTKPGYGACYGDSGSPLVHNNMLIGLALSVHPDCAEGYPDVYARVTHYLTFIQSTIS